MSNTQRTPDGFTQRISRGSHSRRLVRTSAAFGLTAVLALASSLTTKAACVFDNMSNVLYSNLSAVVGTGSAPNFFMGDGYLLLPGVTNITGFDIFPANITGTNFTGIQINIYVWQYVNLGAVNTNTPAFSNLLASYTLTSSGAFNTGFYYIFQGSPPGVNPGLTLGTPLAISGTNIGITFNYKGTYDGVTYFNSNFLYEIIAYGAPPSVGGQNFNGYYRNASGETNGNFVSALRSLGRTNQTLGLRVFGNVAGGPPPTSAGLVINPIWDSSILNDPNVSDITNTINTAILSLESRFYDPVTVNILFQEMNSGLGQSETWISTIPYSSYYNALVTDSKTTNDIIALGNVTGGPNNPVNGGANITLPLAGLRALGFTANSPTNWDSIVSLNTSIMNLTRPPLNSTAYDLQATVTHEMDEVLGTSSGVGQANIHPPDLFRYTAAGARSFTTVGDDAWFSIDGLNNLVQYNQDPTGDYGDWWSASTPAVPRVQDAFGTPGTTPDLAEELIVLDVVGWDLVPASVQPPVLNVSVTGTTANLSWSSAVPNRPYQVQYKTNLTQASWLNLGSVIIATNTTMTATDTTTSSPERFYRVAMLPARSAARPVNQGEINGPFVLDTRVMNPKPGSVVRPPSRGIRLVQPRAVPITQSQAE